MNDALRRQRRQARTGSQSVVRGDRSRRALATAAAAGVPERLEPRQLFSAAPTATIVGPATVGEGATYALSLSTANLGATSVDHWTVSWGDGQSTVPGTATEADHVYADGPTSFTVTAAATLSDGTVVPANQTTAGVANPGALDPAFGVNGEVVTGLGSPAGSASSFAAGVAVADTGDAFVAGSGGAGSSTGTVVAYTSAGAVDPAFGTAGQVSIPHANVAAVLVQHVADPYAGGAVGERLVVVGSTSPVGGAGGQEQVWRYTLGDGSYGVPDGTPDATFGTAGVTQLPYAIPGDNIEADRASAAVVTPAGQVVVAGVAANGPRAGQGGTYVTVGRLNADGSVDTTFAGTGQQLVTTSPYDSSQFPVPLAVGGVAVAADGSVFTVADGVGGGYVSKLTPAGQPDAAFGTAGQAQLNPSAGNSGVDFNAVTLDAAGNLILGGAFHRSSIEGWALGRFDPTTGAADLTFGAGDAANRSFIPGVEARWTTGTNGDRIKTLVTLPGGQLLAGGTQGPVAGSSSTSTDLTTIVRYDADGTPDASFGTGGTAQVDFGSTPQNTAGLAVQTDGKVLAAETFIDPAGTTGFEYALARLGQTQASTATPVTVAVANVPPTVAITTAPPADVPEGSVVNLAATVTDPSPTDTAAGFSGDWRIVKDGTLLSDSSGSNYAAFGFTPADNGTYVVTYTATDKDGGHGSATTTVTVDNVAPTPAIAAAATAGTEGTAVSLTGSATDPSSTDTAAGLALAWSVTKNGSPYAAAGTGGSYTFTPDDNGTYVVALTATDKDGGVGTTTDTIAVANVAPTAAITAPVTTGKEGTAVALSGSATDVSTADTNAGLTLAWAVTKNGAAFAAGTGATFTFTPDDNGTYGVSLTATDKDGGTSATATDSVSVANVAPTAVIPAPVTAGKEGSAVTLTGTATDPSTADTAAGLTLAWSVTKDGAAFGTGSGPTYTFNPTDNGTYALTLTATDKDGGAGTTTDTVAVANVAPTAVITAPVSTGKEGTAIALTGSATDPSTADTAAGLALGWAVTKNGAAYGTGTGAGYTFTPTDNGTYVVTLTATDKDGGTGTTADTIAVANVAPTAVFAAAVTAGTEGSAVTLTGSATDPSPVDTAAGLKLTWAVAKNGAAYATGTGSAVAFTPNDNGTYVVTLSATDKDGGVGTATDTVAVANVAPTAAAVTGPAKAVRYQLAQFASSFIDPGTLDTHTVTWNFGDGSAPVTTSLAAGVTGAVAGSHAFAATGTYQVSVTVTDKDGGASTKALPFTVDAADLQADPASPGKTALFVGGTSATNVILVYPGSNSTLTASVNNLVYTNFAPTGRVVVLSGPGNNTIQVSSSVTLPTELYGGAGSNWIKGGSGPNIEVGGAGTDVLVAGSGRDILLGGGGGDLLVGGSGNDLMVAMATAYDYNPAALEAVQREWTRTDVSFAQQVTDLTKGGGLNGSVVIAAGTTTNDNAGDLLIAGSGTDAFFVSNGDTIVGATGGDRTVDLSWVTT